MSLKLKLISTMGAFLLVLCFFIVSVLAVPQVTLNIGGNVTFEAKDVQATISKGVLSNGTLVDSENKMQEVILDAEHDGASALSTWSGLELSFNESGSDMTITFSITNNHPEKNLIVSISSNIGTANNATMDITSTSGNTSNINIPANKGTSSSEEITVTFGVESKNQNASINNFSINVNLNLSTSETYTVTAVEPSDPMASLYGYAFYSSLDSVDATSYASNLAEEGEITSGSLNCSRLNIRVYFELSNGALATVYLNDAEVGTIETAILSEPIVNLPENFTTVKGFSTGIINIQLNVVEDFSIRVEFSRA